MKPLISIQLRDGQGPYMPGDELECRYQIDAVDAQELQAVEASVLWYSEGKGEEDLAVHAFQRHVPADIDDRDLRRWNSLTTRLPNSPLSYDGVILKIHWCVRVRVFGFRGKEATAELPFRLGNVPAPPRPMPPAESGKSAPRTTLAIAELTSSARPRQSEGEDGE
ncbi:MAG: hypothetical protein U0939_08125 [Pirellulales bacterium]